jgi:Reverse transcriptase (RNA-dependent DNA polymerase)
MCILCMKCHGYGESGIPTCSPDSHTREATIQAGRVGAVLLMDISQFFDSLSPSIMSHILRHLGVDKETVGWVHSLMADCTVQIQVKDFSLEGFQPGNGMLQGSPASPILSTLFTVPLLRLAETWVDTDLSLYVDDGSVFASSATFRGAAAKVACAGSAVFTWLRQFGLEADLDKTEVMFFHPPCPSCHLGS